MPFDTKAHLIVKTKDFPVGKIHNLHIWFSGNWKRKDINEKVNEKLDDIKSHMEKIGSVHSIEVTSVSYTNMSHPDEKYGDLILTKSSDASPEKVVQKVVEKFNIRKIDLPNTPKEDLVELMDKIEIEFFKREHHLSDDVYNFFKENEDLVTLDEAKKYCEKHGADDVYVFRKMKVRELVNEKILSNG